jgi:5'(3')-deoxyribonucleotidase
MKEVITFMLDMDGVCCDWVTAGLKTVGKEELIGNWKPGVRDLEEMTGLSYDELWSKIDAEGSEWWRNLEPFPWFKELYNCLGEAGDVVFCTSPSWDSNSLKGKIEWMHDKFGRSFREYILTNHKYYVARHNTVLIDDNDKQCQNFIAHGGRAILFPQPWNSLAFDEEAQKDKMAYVRKQVKEILA